MGLALHFARRYDEAIGEGRKALEMDPNFAAGHRRLGLAFEQKAMYTDLRSPAPSSTLAWATKSAPWHGWKRPSTTGTWR